MTVVGERLPYGNALAVTGAGRQHEPITPGQTKKRSSHTSNQFAELDAHNSGKKRSATEAPGGEFIRIPPFRPSGTFPLRGKGISFASDSLPSSRFGTDLWNGLSNFRINY